MKDDQDNLPSERSVWVASIISALELAATGTTWSPYPSEAAALLFEIERLRAHNAELQTLGVSLHKAAAAGRDAERAAVVAWLEKAGWMPSMVEVFKRGEHRREEEK
jgi:hypothetical protein